MKTKDNLNKQRSNRMKMVTLTIVLVIAGAFRTYAQDVITLKSGEEIKAKVTEVSSSEIKYKRFEHLDGPTIVVEKAKVFAVNYENGTREVFNAASETPAAKAETQIQETTPVESSRTRKQAKPNVGVFFNPAGFLTFGPMVGAEFSAGKFDMEANVFFPQVGLLTPIMDGLDCLNAEGGIGFGASAKFYTNRTNGGFYVGGFTEYWKTKFVYSSGFADAAGIAFGTHIGYKFVLPFGLYFRTGAYLGAQVTTKYDWYDSWGYRDDSGEWFFFGYLDLTIGFNFLKVKR